ncbi:MAG: RNA polymerase sigma factor [Gammaproteobacteria bacterium]|nr:MAG: RNA polymerase sigma factor [Gammaproteobacteria bacterium]
MNREPARADSRIVELSERQWLPRHARGDADAFPELMAAYRAPVWGYLVRCGVSPQLREDLFQDIFLKIHQSAPSYRPSWPLRPWVFTIAANTLRNHVRDQKRFRQFFTTDELPDPPDPLPRAEDIAIIAETKAWLDDAIMQLPFSQREVLVLVALESLPLKEVAAILRVSQNTVKTRLRRARLKLADMLAAHEGTEQSPGDSDD